MDDPLDNDALDVAPSVISDEEEDPNHRNTSNHFRYYTHFSPDPHLLQLTLIPPYKDSEGVPKDDLETADPEGDPEGATLGNKYTPIGVYFEEPPYDFALPTSNQPDDPPSQSEAAYDALLLSYHYRYGHISFRRLKTMAEQRVIPRRLKDIPTPA